MKSVKVLVVDDELEILELLKEEFESIGCQVRSAADGEEGLVVYQEFKPNIVFSDINMPKKNGMEFLEAVMALPGDKPYFVLMSGFCDVTEEEVKKLGAAHFIHKPVDFDFLLSLVKKVA